MAVVFPYVYDAIFQDPLVMQILEGIEAEATIANYNLLLSTPQLTSKTPDDRFASLVQSGYIDGMIALDNVVAHSAAQYAQERDMPVVVLGYHENAYYVRSNDYEGGRMLLRYLVNHGHKSIGIISIPNNVNFAIDERLRGINDEAEAVGLDASCIYRVESDFSTVSGASAAETLFKRATDVTGIICTNDRTAVGAMQYLNQIGHKIPEDISIVGYDDIPIASYSNPPLTTIDQHALEQGRTAARMLIDILNKNQPSSVVLEPTLHERSSVKARR